MQNVRIQKLDLRLDPLPGSFDLIVASAVLEYFFSRKSLRAARDKLTAALRPGGYLLVETTRCSPDVENSPLGKLFIRGKWTNVFVAKHPLLRTMTHESSGWFVMTLFRKEPGCPEAASRGK